MVPAAFRPAIARTNPMEQLAQPEELARMALFLAATSPRLPPATSSRVDGSAEVRTVCLRMARAATSKLPDLSATLTRELPIDTLYTLLADADFEKYQDEMDAMIEEHVRR